LATSVDGRQPPPPPLTLGGARPRQGRGEAAGVGRGWRGSIGGGEGAAVAGVGVGGRRGWRRQCRSPTLAARHASRDRARKEHACPWAARCNNPEHRNNEG
jgi:hypothetical protein